MENLLNINQFTIPPLQCSFALGCHHDHSEIKEAGESWIVSQFNLSFEAQKKFLAQSQYPLFACVTYPTGDKNRCLSITKFLAWLFLFDDINDDLKDVGGSLSAAEDLFQSLVSTLRAKHSSGTVCRIVSIALDWWNELSRDFPATQQSRFFQLLETSLAAWKSQISFREAKLFPDVQTYVVRRRKASGALICFLLLEYSLGMELDQETLNNPLISQLHDAAIDHISWVNDLLSFKGEYLRGEYDNLPSVICVNKFPDFQESVCQVRKMIQERDKDFVRMMKEIKRSTLMEKPGLLSYVDGLGSWMAGNLYWSYITARYHGVDHYPKSTDIPLHILLHPATAISKS